MSASPATPAPTQANAKQRYEVGRDALPLSCPLPSMALWNSHPRVYLPIEADRRGRLPLLRRALRPGRLMPRRGASARRMRRLTVAQLLPALESGGVERSTLEIAQALARAGHRALVVSAGGRLLPALEARRRATPRARHRPQVAAGPAPRARAAALFARASRSTSCMRVRACRRGWAGARCAACRRGAPAPGHHRARTQLALALQRDHGPRRTRGSACRKPCASTCCAITRRPIRRQAAGDPRGIDPARSRARMAGPRSAPRGWRAHPALAGEGPLLLLPGRGTRLKGHADAHRAAGALRADRPATRACGCRGARDPDRARYVAGLEAHAARCGVTDAIAMTAPTDAIAQAYAASDLVLQLSRKPEAFGRTVLEALSVGRPVLGWDHGGVGELLARCSRRARWRRSMPMRCWHARSRCWRTRRRRLRCPIRIARDAGRHARVYANSPRTRR
jgi:glycosyltransferase involved in cell wall biosynthesis/uncharacterized Zn-finger protein